MRAPRTTKEKSLLLLSHSFDVPENCDRENQMRYGLDGRQVEHSEVSAIGYATRLLGSTDVAKDTMAFQFEKPRNFVFRAGQSVDLTLIGSTQERSDRLTHTFSIASGPSAQEIIVATRMRDTAFKRSLAALPIGTEVELEGPRGSFTLHNNTARPAVLLAGGIGIAPFLSIVSHAQAEGLRHSIVLFYANRRLEDAAFIDSLVKLSRQNPRFRFVPTLTRLDGNRAGWNGESGRISPKMLSRHVGNLRGPIFYIAGPPLMVAAARRALVDAAVDEDDIRTEEFAGY